MRNPINSIKSQILFQKNLNKKINDLINDTTITSNYKLKKKLMKILK